VDERVDLAHPARWVDASEVAVYLGTDREWVYRHGLELDGRELGSGPKAPWRFKLSLVDAALGGCPVLLVHGRDDKRAGECPAIYPGGGRLAQHIPGCRHPRDRIRSGQGSSPGDRALDPRQGSRPCVARGLARKHSSTARSTRSTAGRSNQPKSPSALASPHGRREPSSSISD
jgi:hypothetical protein